MNRRRVSRGSAFSLWLVGMAVCLGGCGGGDYSTPEATFETAKAAGRAKDWKTMYDCYTPESLDTMAGMLALAGSFGGEKTAAVLEQHGVDKAGPGAMAAAMQAGKAPHDVGKDLVKNVGDKSQFIADMQNAMEQTRGTEAGQFAEDAKLEGLTIDGDSATARMVFEGKSMPLKFKNIGGDWKLEFILPTLGESPDA
ncbi:MAG: hypothetical protein RIC55_05645 [Pirellulaceae bacterium]